MAIDTSNISFINYLWTKKNSDGTLTGIRLSKDNLPTDTVYNSSLDSKVNKSGDTMTGNLTIKQGSAINVSQYNDASGVSLMNNGNGTATQFGSSSRPARMFSSVQPEWYKNGASQGILALKSDIPAVNNGTITIKQTGVSDQAFTVNQSNNTTITLVNTWRPLGTGASDACAGNDARLSDARTPKAHTHVSNDITDALTLIQGNNITLTRTASGLEISAAADGKVKTVNNKEPDENGNVTISIPTSGTTASAVGTTASGGSATTWSKSDHVHNISLATGDNNGQVKIAGTNVSVKGLGSAAYTPSTAYATSGHTHSFNQITSRGEAFLGWGGKNFSGSYGPIDAAMVPELGANRLAFMPANAVTIEYSRDGGSTWIDYGPTDSQKINLFNGLGSSFTIGKATSGEGNIATNKYQLRVNIYTSTGKVYTALNKFVIYLSTSGTNNNWCTIRARKQSDYTAGNDTWTTFADKISVSGWSGYNVINTSGITTYGNTASTQYGHIQFIFGCDTGSTNNSYAGLNINKIFGFGGVGWTTPSTMAKSGRIYTYDSSQNVTFPAAITSGTINSYNIIPRANNTYNLGSSSSKWANVYATTIYENGKTLSATYIAKSLLTAKGDMIYASAANTPERLGIGSNGQFLSIANGIPKWVNNPNSDTHYVNSLQIKGNGTEAVKFTQNADKSLNLKPGNNVSISAASGEITISATVPTKSSWNYDDTYVKYSAAQSLNDTQKAQARTNIGAGTSSLTLGTTSSTAAAGNHNHDGVYLKSFTESDPVFSASAAAGIKASDITNWNGKTSNTGTVTSVRVQAGTGLSSSQNTAQTSTLNTTISIASGYKLPTATEWAERPSINDAYSISAGNGIVLTQTASSLEISAKVKTVNNQEPDPNGNVTVPIPTALKNPNALTFGSKTYDGSSAKTITASDLGALTSHQDISGKQDQLVSGTNIKTINGESILGSGDLTISGGGSTVTVDSVSQDNLSFLRFTIS